MFTLDELIIREGAQLGYLIDDRARLFLHRFDKYPTTGFISLEQYDNLIRELTIHHNRGFTTHSAIGYCDLAFNTSIGKINLIVKKEVKSFLLIGLENTYADFDCNFGIPRELWSDSSRKKMDEDFELTVLKGL